MKSKLYQFNFTALWLGGTAIIKAINEEAAYKALKKEWPNVEPLKKCRVKELQDRDGIIYFDNGDY